MERFPLPETNSSHCNTSFLLGWPIFGGELLVSGRVCGSCIYLDLPLVPRMQSWQ